MEIHGRHDSRTMDVLAQVRSEMAVVREAERKAEAARKVPVTVLTGFLGAGKTTLLNYILRAKHGWRIAVIENEIGAIGIDNQLIDSAGMTTKTEELVTLLDNGCLCCTVRSDLIPAVLAILDKAEAAAANQRAEAATNGLEAPPANPLDAILIETTGLADPGPVCKTFFVEEQLRARTRMDGVLTVVDAVHFLQQLNRERSDGSVNESVQQVAFADTLLLNKIDCVKEGEIPQLEAELQQINSTCRIIHSSLTQRANEVPLDQLLGCESFALDRVLTDFEQRPGLVQPLAKRRRGPNGAQLLSRDYVSMNIGKAAEALRASKMPGEALASKMPEAPDFCSTWKPKSRHDTGVTTFSYDLTGAPLILDRFLKVMNTIRAENAVDLYRYKGAVCVKEPSGALKRAVLQGVHDLCEFEPRGPWPSGEPPRSQIVFIGRKLDEALWGRLLEKTKEGVLDEEDAS